MKNLRRLTSLIVVCHCFTNCALSDALEQTWIDKSDSDFNNPSNWTPAPPKIYLVPTDIATFGSSGSQQVSFEAPTTLNTINFAAGAQAYTLSFAGTGDNLTLNGAGLINQSSNNQMIYQTAGTSIILNNAATITNVTIQGSANSGFHFNEAASAGTAQITNQSTLDFNSNSTAGSASITNMGQLFVNNSATLGLAKIVNNSGGTITFTNNESQDQAAITNNAGGIINLTGTSASLRLDNLTNSGTINAGGKTLILGGSGNDSTMSGVLTGSNASLTKIGNGVLTLTGVNQYAGVTTISAGTLRLTNQSLLTNIVDNATLEFNEPNNTTSILYPNLISGTGSLLKTGNGTLTLFGANTYNGATIVAGGTLTGSLTNLQRDIVNNASVVFNQASDGTYSYIMSGTGSLTKTGSGTLILTGANTYTGGNIISQGTLQGNTSSLHGNIVNNSNLIFNQTIDDTYTGLISSTGTLTKTGDGKLTLSGLNTYTGSTTVNQGTLQLTTANIKKDITNNATVIFAQDTDGDWAGSMTGAGALIKNGAGMLTLSGDSSQMTGNTTINAGTLNLAGSLLGTLHVMPGATLTGSGVAGDIVNRGIVDPGTSGAGTLNATSLFGPGALLIHFNGAEHNQLNLSGSANLDGATLRLVGTQFAPNSYTILSSGGLTSSFATVEAPPFLAYSIQTLGSDVKIVVHSFSFASPATSKNELALGGALDVIQAHAAFSLAAQMIPALGAITTAAEAQTALESMSGDAWTSFTDVALKNAALFSNQIMDRSVPMDSASAAAIPTPATVAHNGDIRTLNIGNSASDLESVGHQHRGIWARALGAVDHVSADSGIGSPSTSANTGGFQAGFDRVFNEDTTYGVALGYAHTALSVDDRDSSGHSNALGLTFYTRHLWNAWIFNGNVGFTDNSNHLDRSITFANAQANGDSKSKVFSAFGEAAYAFEPWVDTAVEPSISLRVSHLSQAAFTESGAPGLDLAFDSQSLNSVVPTVGARLSHLFHAESRHPFVLGGRLGIESELADVDRTLSAHFVNSPTTAYAVDGTPQKRIGATLEFNGRVALRERLQAYGNYGLDFSSAHSGQRFFGGIRWIW